MILVTGASGKTGKAIITALVSRREAVRAFVHRADHADDLKALGVAEVIVGDLLDADAVRGAMDGVISVYHICPNVNPDEVEIGRIAIQSALATGVAHFVYHSVLHPQVEAMPHHWNKLRVEELLFASGLPFTILQPTAYMQNILGSWRSIVEQGVYPVPYPVETRLSLVDLDDVAKAAANVLTELGHTRAVYELVGTRGLTQTEVATVLDAKLGHPVRAESISHEEWAAGARASGMDDYQCETLLKMFRYYAEFGMLGNSNTLGWLLGHAPTTFPAFVARIIGV